MAGPDASHQVLSVCGNAITRRRGVWYTHHSFGRIIEQLVPHFARVRYHAPRSPEAEDETLDYPLDAPTLTVHAWPTRRNTLHAMKRPARLLRDYWRMVRSCDVLFLRGSGPLLWTAHWMARLRHRPVVHWVISNPPAMLRGELRGYTRRTQALGLQFARFEQAMTRASARMTGVKVLANGAELAHLYRSPRTVQVVSTSITEADFLERDDPCEREAVRILFVGFIRPEKGLEYLVRAMPLVEAEKPVHLAIVGSDDKFPDEGKRLRSVVAELGVEDCIRWEGYAPFGKKLFDQMDRSDILVLPSLSEGTPRVLVEARARSLPVVATNVGGIPSSVSDRRDGLLVRPRDPAAIAHAITEIIRDRALRRRLIAEGHRTARQWTVAKFVHLVTERLCESATGLRSGR